VVITSLFNSLKCVNGHTNLPYPTQIELAASVVQCEHENNTTVVTSNTSGFAKVANHHAVGIGIKPSLAVADTDATSFFLTKNALCQNKPRATHPVTVTLPEGQKIASMHICDVTIPGLPTIPLGHIMPDMATASLFRIIVLCKAGCTVVFDDNKCQVIYYGKIFLLILRIPSATFGHYPSF
jgi:hypothetical protein